MKAQRSVRSVFASMLLAFGLWLLAVTTLAQTAPAHPARVSPHHAEDQRIRDLVAAQVTAWDAGDAKAFSAHFAEDGTFTNIRGTVFYGHKTFEDRHEEIFRTFFKGSKLAMTVNRIKYVRPDVAIVDIATEVSELKGTPPGISANAAGHIETRLQEVLVRNKGAWEIASYHNVDVKGP